MKRCRFIPFLFGLAPCGVCHAPCITARAVRSYRTFSPLPWLQLKGSATACACFALAPGSSRTALTVRSPSPRRYVLCGTFRRTALKLPSRTLSGTLLCGVRTFLSLSRAARETPAFTARQRPSGPTSTIHIIRWIRIDFDARWLQTAAYFIPNSYAMPGQNRLSFEGD